MKSQTRPRRAAAEKVPMLLMTPEEAARALRISQRRLWELTSTGDIPCKKIGKLLRYRVSDLEAWRDKP